jgi:predicted TIM-barrel fold metal-dependent hydrolase
MKTIVGLFLFGVLFIGSATIDHSAPVVNQAYTGPIIDMHIHAYTAGGLMGVTHPPTLRGKTMAGVKTPEEQKREVLARFKKYNIVKAVVTNGELWIKDAPDQVLIANAEEPIDSLRKKYTLGQLKVLAEMGPFYEGIKADDPSQDAYFKLAAELDIPVGFHIFPGGPNNGFHLGMDMLKNMRAYNANPMQLENVLTKYPNLRLYIMHGGWPYVEDVKALMYAHSNLYVDIAVINWILPQQECHNYLKALIDAGFGDRIMYGSDEMVWPQTIDIGIETVNAAAFLTAAQKEDIFYNNAARFLRLSKEEINKHKGLR